MATRNVKTAVYCQVAVSLALAFSCVSRAQSTASRPIKITVDATHASSQKILRSDLEIPVTPGPLTLYYSKWMAYFKGSIEIEKSAEKEGDKNVFSRTASATPAAGAGLKSI